MNRFVSLFISLVISSTFIAGAFSYRNLPDTLCGSMMPYNFSQVEPAEWPDSLTVVHSEYVARHGSRYLSGEAKVGKIRNALVKARDEHKLTAEGIDFLTLLDSIWNISSGKWGSLSTLGVEEEQQLGKEITTLLPPLKSRGAKVNALSSPVPRVVMTMYQFLHAVNERNDSVSVSASEGPEYMSLLCPFVTDKEYSIYREEGDWKKVYDRFLDAEVSEKPAIRMLGENSGYSRHKLRELTMEIYGVIQGNMAYGLPTPTTKWMTVDEFRRCYLASNLKHYLRNSITPANSTAGKAIAPLLKEMIEGCDKAIGSAVESSADSATNADGSFVMNCYFGHAETLLPLLSLMDIPPASTISNDPAMLQNSWQVYKLTPLAANLALSIMHGPSGAYYAALRLNGRNIPPMPGDSRMIVEWKNLRSFWMSRIDKYLDAN